MKVYKNPTHAKIWYCDACMSWKEIDAFDWRVTKAWCVKCHERINSSRKVAAKFIRINKTRKEI